MEEPRIWGTGSGSGAAFYYVTLGRSQKPKALKGSSVQLLSHSEPGNPFIAFDEKDNERTATHPALKHCDSAVRTVLLPHLRILFKCPMEESE